LLRRLFSLLRAFFLSHTPLEGARSHCANIVLRALHVTENSDLRKISELALRFKKLVRAHIYLGPIATKLYLFGYRFRGQFVYFRLEDKINDALSEASGRSKYPFVEGRILHINSALAPGGSERQLVNTVIGLLEKGNSDISVLCERLFEFEESDFFLPRLKALGIRVEKLSSDLLGEESIRYPAEAERTLFRCLPKEIRSLALRYYKSVIQVQPEVVHIWQDQTSVIAGLACVFAGVPKIILAGRNMAPIHFPYVTPYMKPIYRVLAGQNCVRITNNSVAGAQDYSKWLVIKSDKITVIRNGFVEQDFPQADETAVARYRRNLKIPEASLVVGSIFRFWPEKNPILWLEAAKYLVELNPQRELVFLLVGDGPLFARSKTAARRFGLQKSTIFAGKHLNPAVPLSIMDLFLLTSKLEGTPNVLIEAQYLGVPVVTTNAGGAAATILAGSTGDVVHSFDPWEIAKKVNDYLCNVELQQRSSKNGRQHVRASFSLDRMINKTLLLYERRA